MRIKTSCVRECEKVSNAFDLKQNPCMLEGLDYNMCTCPFSPGYVQLCEESPL